MVLPYMEGATATDGISSFVRGQGATVPINHAVYSRITSGNTTSSYENAGLLCPSGPRATQVVASVIAPAATPAWNNTGTIGRLSYKACVGGGSTPAANINNTRTNRNNVQNDGSFSYVRGSNFADLTDGTSNVVVAGEVAMMYTRPGNFIGSVARRTPNNTGANATPANHNPNPCTPTNAHLQAKSWQPGSGNVAIAAAGLQGQFWHWGHPVTSGFSTVYPPNGPSCATTALQNLNQLMTTNVNETVISASSYHPGGAQVVLGDGSVKFISETIDRATWRRAGDKADSQPVQLPD
jgi:hypothetical protein